MKPVVNLQEKKIIIYLDNILILSLSIIGAFKLGNIHGRYRFIHFISKIKRNFVNTLFKLSDGKVQKKKSKMQTEIRIINYAFYRNVSIDKTSSFTFNDAGCIFTLLFSLYANDTNQRCNRKETNVINYKTIKCLQTPLDGLPHLQWMGINYQLSIRSCVLTSHVYFEYG